MVESKFEAETTNLAKIKMVANITWNGLSAAIVLG